MLKSTAMTTIVLAMLLSPPAAIASPWTEGQAEWFRHGARHGRWDCYGKCPEGRAHRDTQRHHYRQR
ncbi:hypothetical protein [Methylocystis sp. SC2]|uniref:hypothetical protein n=1 Tax=Methylocystis sp. (strain SC2) TaxID=187303 RepID=UPI00027AF474|nr:hypothetical protein [Methylocystis sp. SC2]CCJ06050.1 Hypothetical protein BN69_0599 [Methylocystis sp. SC2]